MLGAMATPRLLSVWCSILCLATGVGAQAKEALTLTRPSVAQWEFLSPEKVALESVATFDPDSVVKLAGKPMGYVVSRETFENCALHVEWRWTAKPGNSGILVNIDSGPIDDHLWPRCLQVQMKHARAGDLLPMAGAMFREPLTSPPGVKPPLRARLGDDSEKPAGEWNVADIVCRNGVIEVTINGVKQNRVTDCRPSSGRVGFQFEGAPYEVRHVSVERLP